MSLDEALLDSGGGSALRLYRWQPRALSLGYFQDHAAVVAALPEPIALVRRITGGGAIWHEHEVTYCLVGNLGEDGLPTRTADCYRRLHTGIASAIAAVGARLELQGETTGDRRYAREPRCFASPAADDLVHPCGGKVLGSAARTRGNRVLIHGSLKLASNPWDGPLVAGCGLDAEAASRALRSGIAAALGQTGRSDDFSADELASAERIRLARYATPEWVVERRGPRP